jgi:hypothetical protein
MPHAQCSTCRHPDVTAIDSALAVGSRSIRELARHFGLSKDSLHRHRSHSVSARGSQKASVNDIEEEIVKLQRAQKQAKKRRDTSAVLRISAELRQWMTLRSKADAIAVVSERRESQEIGRGEAVQLAKALIESELTVGSIETFSWLESLLERFAPAIEASGKPLVNRSQTGGITSLESGDALKDLVAEDQTLSLGRVSGEDES